MIADPQRRGRDLAELFGVLAPRLYSDILESGVLPHAGHDSDSVRARQEWECFALYACVRGLVAAGGFNRETAAAIEALHEQVLEAWKDAESSEGIAARRARISDRYSEYGAIGQEGGAKGAATVTQRLGEAAARHMVQSESAPAELAELVGSLHESLAEGAAEAVREAR